MTKLFDESLALKHVTRAGWLRAGISTPETVAAHSWGVAWLVMNHCPDNLNIAQALKLALVHDLPEVFAGDITPHDGISSAEKAELEVDAARRLFDGRPDLLDLWKEYPAAKTPEALFVKECDALDMGLQAIRYAQEYGVDTTEFVTSARAKLRTPALLTILEEASEIGRLESE